MRHRRNAGLLIATSVVLLATPQLAASADEPVYEGRTLTSWLEDFAVGRFPDMDKHRAAEDAIRQIGVDALPLLIERLTITSPASQKLIKRVQMLEAQGELEQASVAEAESLGEDIQTVSAFRALGADAHPAIPTLIELVTPAYDAATAIFSGPAERLKDDKSTAAAEALAAIGPAAIPPLIKALNEGGVSTRFAAALALRYFANEDRTIVPALLDAFGDRNPDVRQWAIRSIGSIRRLPDLSVPALVERLHNDPDNNVRCAVLIALGWFGRNAESAVPDIIEATTDPSPSIQGYARRALERIRKSTDTERKGTPAGDAQGD
ncbi:MAG: hypothetical protein DWQ34_17955 [Planctomycetota bacterium]|nr:MAG: hypothetical protein DWQ29_10730 [Planctomycetota bacterium]REJ90166.1 MAG: hypothetical protein DWQ34_17955 [Planctomycetota bacterium]REK20114.1 MAG: hypothetical protein DWQ41_26330 [Planctomycetota bacterium]REK34304.1 MAG: hypothetical protein DWQ45_13565 [Planctomycetota bacterium]